MPNEDYLPQFEQTREMCPDLDSNKQIVFVTPPTRTKAPAPKLQTHILTILSIISLSLVHFRGRLPLSRSSQIPNASRGPEMLQDSCYP